MNLFKSPIILSRNDVFWSDISARIEGMQQRTLLIIVSEFVDELSEKSLLIKMLEASDLRPEQYNILILKEGEQISWSRLRDALEPRIVFLLGVLPAQLGVSSLFILNSPNNFDGRMWLPTVALSVLVQNQVMKGQLWNTGMRPILKDNKFGLI